MMHSESGGMAGANIYALEKNSSSTYALKNYYATKPETPTAGVKQDARLISAQTTNGTLAATFIKSVNGSCDYNDLRIQSGYATPVIWYVSDMMRILSFLLPSSFLFSFRPPFFLCMLLIEFCC
jgi:hypothetical protein